MRTRLSDNTLIDVDLSIPGSKGLVLGVVQRSWSSSCWTELVWFLLWCCGGRQIGALTYSVLSLKRKRPKPQVRTRLADNTLIDVDLSVPGHPLRPGGLQHASAVPSSLTAG